MSHSVQNQQHQVEIKWQRQQKPPAVTHDQRSSSMHTTQANLTQVTIDLSQREGAYAGSAATATQALITAALASLLTRAISIDGSWQRITQLLQ